MERKFDFLFGFQISFHKINETNFDDLLNEICMYFRFSVYESLSFTEHNHICFAEMNMNSSIIIVRYLCYKSAHVSQNNVSRIVLIWQSFEHCLWVYGSISMMPTIDMPNEYVVA